MFNTSSISARTLIVIATLSVAALLLPATAGAAVVRFSESWTDQPAFIYQGEFACAGKPAIVAGTGLESGSVEVIETMSPEGAHVRLDIEGSVDLYEATGPPWDVQFGAYVGTWTYSAHQVEQYGPGGNAALAGVTRGEIVFADGSTAMLKISFTLVLDREDGPKLFFAHGTCAGE
jgi:hypothetical protein